MGVIRKADETIERRKSPLLMLEPAREPVADFGARCQIDAVGAIPRSCRNVYIVFCRGHLLRGSRARSGCGAVSELGKLPKEYRCGAGNASLKGTQRVLNSLLLKSYIIKML
ncbi:MAG: hypothetical protein EAZ73_28195 [Oscillatoriales cyanobacterium]|nr:MAG: hypothetical protein EAZ83_27805 [Oscillatoriales cyanobacterium]TAF14847.1 MAG: hypothetical protein EAZ73_28195 [Oscillatoriales cyanobacterium]TAF31711.1 MAG: hypothetical protein EAZ69_18920 [Oscillatoriales cyanobacterium]